MKVKELKALGAPFRGVEIHVSLKAKVATLVVVSERDTYATDFRLTDDDVDVLKVCKAITRGAFIAGLMDNNSIVGFYDDDALVVN